MPKNASQFLGWEDPLEGEMATHSSILVWKIPQAEPVPSSPWVRKGSDVTENRVSELVQVVTVSSTLNPKFSVSGCVCISVLSPYTDHEFLVSNKLPLDLVTFMELKFHPFHLQIMVMLKM